MFASSQNLYVEAEAHSGMVPELEPLEAGLVMMVEPLRMGLVLLVPSWWHCLGRLWDL